MILRGDPTYPAARALLGDYAVAQHSQDRTEPLLNEVMDTTFKPIHDAWKLLWKAQQDAEQAMNAARAVRFEAVQALNDAVRTVFRALQSTLGPDSPELKRCLPCGTLDVLYRPVAQLLADLSRYVEVIAALSPLVLPTAPRDALLVRFAEACAAQGQVDDAHVASLEAQLRRRAADDIWAAAFEAFHRAVAHVAFRNHSNACDWVQSWMSSTSTSAPHPSSLLLERAPAMWDRP